MSARIMMFGPQNLGPYHVARFRALRPLVEDFVYVRVPYKEYKRPWHIDEAEFPGTLLTYGGDYEILLDKYAPTLVVTVGIFHPVFWGVALSAKARGVRVLARIEGHALGRDMQSPKEKFKDKLLSTAYSGVSLWGKRPLEYARLLGVPENRIHLVPMVVDNDHFRLAHKGQEREGIGTAPAFLTVARLHPDKNLHRLLLAFGRYRAAGGTWDLVLVGGKPTQSYVDRWLPADTGVRASVHWLGWQSYDALPKIYHDSGVFVLPSVYEPWGLVVNEALAAGLPVLISKLVGCAPDLCVDGYNGFQFDPYDVDAISDALFRMEQLSSDDRRDMGEKGQQLVGRLTPADWAYSMAELATGADRLLS